jgi:hypothetical protein
LHRRKNRTGGKIPVFNPIPSKLTTVTPGGARRHNPRPEGARSSTGGDVQHGQEEAEAPDPAVIAMREFSGIIFFSIRFLFSHAPKNGGG